MDSEAAAWPASRPRATAMGPPFSSLSATRRQPAAHAHTGKQPHQWKPFRPAAPTLGPNTDFFFEDDRDASGDAQGFGDASAEQAAASSCSSSTPSRSARRTSNRWDSHAPAAADAFASSLRRADASSPRSNPSTGSSTPQTSPQRSSSAGWNAAVTSSGGTAGSTFLEITKPTRAPSFSTATNTSPTSSPIASPDQSLSSSASSPQLPVRGRQPHASHRLLPSDEDLALRAELARWQARRKAHGIGYRIFGQQIPLPNAIGAATPVSRRGSFAAATSSTPSPTLKSTTASASQSATASDVSSTTYACASSRKVRERRSKSHGSDNSISHPFSARRSTRGRVTAWGAVEHADLTTLTPRSGSLNALIADAEVAGDDRAVVQRGRWRRGSSERVRADRGGTSLEHAQRTSLRASPRAPDDFYDVGPAFRQGDCKLSAYSASSDDDEERVEREGTIDDDSLFRSDGERDAAEKRELADDSATRSYSTVTTSTSVAASGSLLSSLPRSGCGGDGSLSPPRKSIGATLRGLANVSAAVMTRSISSTSSTDLNQEAAHHTPAHGRPSRSRSLKSSRSRNSKVAAAKGAGARDAEELRRSFRILERQRRKDLRVLLDEPSSPSPLSPQQLPSEAPAGTALAQDLPLVASRSTSVAAEGDGSPQPVGLGLGLDLGTDARSLLSLPSQPSLRRESMSIPVDEAEDPLLGGQVGSIEDLVVVESPQFIQSNQSSASSTPRGTSPSKRPIASETSTSASATDRRTGFASLYAMRLSSLQSQLRVWSLSSSASSTNRVSAFTDSAAASMLHDQAPTPSSSLISAGLRQLARLPNLLLNVSAFEAQTASTLGDQTAGRSSSLSKENKDAALQATDTQSLSMSNRPSHSPLPAAASGSISDSSKCLRNAAIRGRRSYSVGSADGRGVMTPLEADIAASAYVSGLGEPSDPDVELSSVVHLETFRSSYTSNCSNTSLLTMSLHSAVGNTTSHCTDDELSPISGLLDEQEIPSMRGGRKLSPPSSRQCAVGLFGGGRASHSSRRTGANTRNTARAHPIAGLKSVHSSPDLSYLAWTAARLERDAAEHTGLVARNGHLSDGEGAPRLTERKQGCPRPRGREGAVKMVSAAIDPYLYSGAQPNQNDLKWTQAARGDESAASAQSLAESTAPLTTCVSTPASSPFTSAPMIMRPTRLLSNGSHLLMLSLELEMIRKHKISAPLKPRWGKQRLREISQQTSSNRHALRVGAGQSSGSALKFEMTC
ncbi:hypothetical protein K437DRAFT_75397 [Tilletiaria anomala UBC 951]|uniref:Uncharacterized protein n=1 Tax=Tilletiaria anomala (strain ATCC 24038 / CBS 436.72 / UBC 951) TaxID=1037660 RepID=A0A066V1M0_TILAU|nr:uncharacterized protein K437DRAFT_75397 [Tilletiaria anomala UBC 951]KDN35607.1 hypothetical protein K437DRAFT_75397 [Tilletiaria anomala UBC 951]